MRLSRVLGVFWSVLTNTHLSEIMSNNEYSFNEYSLNCSEVGAANYPLTQFGVMI